MHSAIERSVKCGRAIMQRAHERTWDGTQRLPHLHHQHTHMCTRNNQMSAEMSADHPQPPPARAPLRKHARVHKHKHTHEKNGAPSAELVRTLSYQRIFCPGFCHFSPQTRSQQQPQSPQPPPPPQPLQELKEMRCDSFSVPSWLQIVLCIQGLHGVHHRHKHRAHCVSAMINSSDATREFGKS